MGQTQECFLKEIADSLYRMHGQQISELTLVFPNRRAGLFFVEYLNRLIEIPIFSPEIVTIQELFSKISPLQLEDQLPLIFHLYKIYRDLSGSKESFDDFYQWGEMLLHDFDQVDKYLVDAELLFTNVTDLKEIDEHFNDWNEERKEEIKHFWTALNSGEQKSDQKEFSRLWQVLFPIYRTYKAELYASGIAFEGMLFRDAVENGQLASAEWLAGRTFVVAGFNALNSCEKRVFQALQEERKISFYWDFDQYYLADKEHEAGLFLRENLRLFPQSDTPYGTESFKKTKKIAILNTSSQVGQAQIAASKINVTINNSMNFDDTAIVLCDEELLLPVLSAIPGEVKTVNVTMGLPLKQTPLFQLMSQIISLQKNCKKEGTLSLFHYNDIINVLNNQLIKSIYPIESQSIIENIIQKNLLYAAEKDLAVNELFARLFTFSPVVSDLPHYFLDILHDLFLLWEQYDRQKYAKYYQEYIYQVYLSINKLSHTLFVQGKKIMGSNDFLTRDTFFRLLLQYLNGLSVTFEGEPLTGLQIMGILETRSLDFKNVILLSVNEGIMPKANVSGSFIPYHLRRGVGLPTVEEQNAMYAYYFYRLLQRAETVTFVYNSGSNGLRTGEKSRFLYQLLLESPFEIAETAVENTIDPALVYPITIEKTGKVLEILDGFLGSGRRMSPTALDQYVKCPLSYYFKYVARFEEEEEVSEEVDARMFGTIFHAVMETLYRPYLQKDVDETIIKSLIGDGPHLDRVLANAFGIQFFRSANPTDRTQIAGRNRLVYEVIKKMVVQTLSVDLKRTPFHIQGLEHNAEAMVPVFQGTKAVRMGGIIDRIDSRSGVLEILDYKTGTTEHLLTSVADLFDSTAVKRNKAAFQTLIYCFTWDKMFPGCDYLYPGIYGLKKIFKEENIRLTFKGNLEVNYQEVKVEFEQLLVKLLEELFNPQIPFSQTTVEDHCKYCNFIAICGKQASIS